MIKTIDPEILFSKASFEDLPEILDLQKIAFHSEALLYNDFNIEPLTQTLDSISSDFYVYTFLKAVFRNKIVGSVKGRQTPEFCWIGRLIVHPDFQNKGIGKKLMTEIESEFPKAKQFLLFTGYKSFRNIKLYESIGYNKIELFTDDKTPDIQLVKMIKLIDNKQTLKKNLSIIKRTSFGI